MRTPLFRSLLKHRKTVPPSRSARTKLQCPCLPKCGPTPWESVRLLQRMLAEGYRSRIRAIRGIPFFFFFFFAHLPTFALEKRSPPYSLDPLPGQPKNSRRLRRQRAGGHLVGGGLRGGLRLHLPRHLRRQGGLHHGPAAPRMRGGKRKEAERGRFLWQGCRLEALDFCLVVFQGKAKAFRVWFC